MSLTALDRRNAEALLRAVSRTEPQRIVVVTHEGEPLPKERPRFGRGRAYTTSKTEGHERALAMQMRAALRGQTFVGNVAVVAVFYRSSRQRIDLDNCVKAVLDAGNLARIWPDDSHVTTQAAFMELDRERPRTVIAIADAVSSLERAMKAKKKGGE